MNIIRCTKTEKWMCTLFFCMWIVRYTPMPSCMSASSVNLPWDRESMCTQSALRIRTRYRICIREKKNRSCSNVFETTPCFRALSACSSAFKQHFSCIWKQPVRTHGCGCACGSGVNANLNSISSTHSGDSHYYHHFIIFYSIFLRFLGRPDLNVEINK